MKILTRNELLHLLERQDPRDLLVQYEDRLDQAGRELLEEALAANQLRAWSVEFSESLPPTPTQPWSERRDLKKPVLWRSPWSWVLAAAAILLVFLPIQYLRERHSQVSTGTRDLAFTSTLTAKRESLTDAWLGLAEVLIREGQDTGNADKTKYLSVALHYLELAIAADPSMKDRERVKEHILPFLRAVLPPGHDFQRMPGLNETVSPPDLLEGHGQGFYQGIRWEKAPLLYGAKRVHDASLELADVLSQKAKNEPDKRQARIDNEWAVTYLEMAELFNISEAEILIRLIRLKEVLGEEEEADIFAERLEKLLN